MRIVCSNNEEIFAKSLRYSPLIFREHHKQVIHKRKIKLIKDNQQKILNFLIGKTCKDCNHSDTRVLEFDHIEDNKKKAVSTLLRQGYRWKTILKEIKKCEIVCANCHRIRTNINVNSYRMG